MKYIKFALIGFLFAIVMYKSEAISWFRIFEMFHFQSFHMYGIIFTAIACSILITALFKKGILKGYKGAKVTIVPKGKGYARFIIGGTIFGFGWGLGGACPGPLYILVGSGYSVLIVFLGAAVLGTLAYGLIKDKLPH